MANLKFLKRIGYSDINTLEDDDSAFFYEGGMMIVSAFTIASIKSRTLAPARVQSFKSLCGAGIVTRFTAHDFVTCWQTLLLHSSPAHQRCTTEPIANAHFKLSVQQ